MTSQIEAKINWEHQWIRWCESGAVPEKTPFYSSSNETKGCEANPGRFSLEFAQGWDFRKSLCDFDKELDVLGAPSGQVISSINQKISEYMKRVTLPRLLRDAEERKNIVCFFWMSEFWKSKACFSVLVFKFYCFGTMTENSPHPQTCNNRCNQLLAEMKYLISNLSSIRWLRWRKSARWVGDRWSAEIINTYNSEPTAFEPWAELSWSWKILYQSAALHRQNFGSDESKRFL